MNLNFFRVPHLWGHSQVTTQSRRESSDNRKKVLQVDSA